MNEKSKYNKQLLRIENKIQQYEKTSIFMNEVKNKLDNIKINGFEKEISEIKSYLQNLDSKSHVIRLMMKLEKKIEVYNKEYKELKKELDKLPIKGNENKIKNEIEDMLSSPKTIQYARDWIRNYESFIDKKNRICFPIELTHFTNEYLIGTGGFARVYKARNIERDQIVAVKIPIKKDKDIGKSFLKELKNWVALNHENIVKIYDYNILPIPYIEMELCDSCLDDIEKPLPLKSAIQTINGIANGLHYAHQQNIVHLDLKPQNILIKDNIPKITDWGLSRLLTMQGSTTIGISLPFAAPEQVSTRFGDKDIKTDIWQIGILFYHLLTNNNPFSGSDFADYAKKIQTKNITQMILEEDSIKDVSHIIAKCLAINKKDRYKNMNYFINDIEQLQ